MEDFFIDSDSKIQRSTFLNKIIENCHNYQETGIFPVNLSETIRIQKEAYQKILEKEEAISKDNEMIQRLVYQLTEQFKKELLRVKQAYPKETGKKFRLNNAVYKRLCQIPKDSYETEIFHTPGKYLKALFEEYARLPYIKREYIVFYPYIQEINFALKHSCFLKVTMKDTVYEILPYNIETDLHSTHFYLIGDSRKYSVYENNTPKMVSCRISRIQDIHCIYTHTASEEQKMKLKERYEKAVKERDVPFLMNDLLNARIRLTDNGYKKYISQQHLRPSYTRNPNCPGEEYIFKATAFQLKSYFFKFGKDAEILSPPELREEFIEEYTQALKIYTIN